LYPNCRSFTFSSRFDYAAFFTRSGVHTTEFLDKFVKVCRFDASSGTVAEIQSIDVQNVIRVEFSPQGTFFAIVLRRNSVTDAGNIPLVQIFRTGGDAMVRSFNYAANHEPELVWSEDESIFAFSHSNGLSFFEGDSREPTIAVALPRLYACQFTSWRGLIAVSVIYEEPGGPKKFKIFHYPNFEKAAAFRSIMVGDTFVIRLNPNGQSAVAIGTKTHSEQTYFGESYAFYLNVSGSQKLILKKQGPIHTIDYSPAADKFVSIAGHVPPSVALHFDKVGGAFEFGQFSVNSVRWSCTGNLVAIGGFGNFNGEVKVIDSQTRQIIAQGEAQYTSAWGWSPCGRLFMSAVLYPKMMVSNEVRIHNHFCQIAERVQFNELTQCEWVGAQHPEPLPKIQLPPPPTTMGAPYVPPHLRKT
jgi:translation initiation factor 2A